MKKVLLLLLTFTLAISLCLVAGCGKKTTTIKTEEGDVKVETDKDEGKVTIEGEDGGKVEIGTGTKIPDNWPNDMPIYSNAEIQGVADISGETGQESLTVILTTPDSIDEIKAYYKKELPANGWTVQDSVSFSDKEDSFGGFTITKGARNGNVTFGTSDEETTISIGVYGE
ncbi:MAG TPA: hypothetical protein ENN38_00260 [Actinobacteria bacterium]|nr:hypothetical protein [Actinomycetota bacterium]